MIQRHTRFRALVALMAAIIYLAFPANAETRFSSTCPYLCMFGSGADCGIAHSACYQYCGGASAAFCHEGHAPLCEGGYFVVCNDPE